jgi:hypothetical protein
LEKVTLETTICKHTKHLTNIFSAIARHADMACEETTSQLINIG